MTRTNLCKALMVVLSALVFGTAIQLKAVTLQEKILHIPPSQYIIGENVELEAFIEGNDRDISNVTLLFKPADQSEFLEVSMEFRYGYYYGTIPAKYATAAGLKYIIVANFEDGSAITYPAENPDDSPAFLPAAGGENPSEKLPAADQRPVNKKSLQAQQLILSPDPGSVIDGTDVLVAITLFPVADVDTSGIHLFVDGVDMTRRAEISRELITYRMQNLRPGPHGIRLVLTNAAGTQYEPLVWSYTVTGEEPTEKPQLQFGGHLAVETSRNQIRNQQENINQLNGSLRGSYGPVNVTSSIYFTSKENPSSQPRNRYSAEMSTSHFRLKIGDSYPRLSQLGMWGKRVRGVDGELRLKFFNLHVVYGKTARALPGNQTESLGQDSLRLTGYTFGRRTFGIRPRFGSGEHFQLGFSFISSRDDTTSVLNNGNQYHRILWEGAKPKDNAVLGTDLTLAFDQRRILWESRASVSWQNNNILGGALSKGDTLWYGGDQARILVSDFPIDPKTFERFFIINNNIQPLLPIPATVDTNYNLSLHPWRIQDYSSLAYESQLRLNYFKNILTLKYKHIAPQFNSFANPYLRRDVEGLEIEDRFRLLQNKMSVSLSYKNLKEGLSRSAVSQISNSIVGIGVSYFPGENLPVINITLNNYARQNGVNEIIPLEFAGPGQANEIDNRIDNNTFSSTVSITQGVQFFGLEHSVNLNYIRSGRSDAYNRSNNESINNLVSLGLRTQYHIPLMTRLFLNYNQNSVGESSSKFLSAGASGSLRLFNEKIYLTSTLRSTNASGLVDFSKTDFDLGLLYHLLENQELSASSRFASTRDPQLGTYTDTILRLRYTYEF